MNPLEPDHRHDPSRATTPAIVSIASALVMLLALRYQFALLNYREWGDESETIVAARMIASGMALYRDVFNHHGPLTFLTGVLLESTGHHGIAGHRVVMILLQCTAVAAILFSPIAADGTLRRLHAALAATIIAAYWPEMHGHTYQYQTIAGVLLVVVLAQYALPAIVCPEKLGPVRVAVGNALLAFLPFLAITYLPVAALLFAVSVRRRYLAVAATAAAAGLAFNIAFLLLIGSLPGYLAFHLYLNAVVLPMFSGADSPFALLKPVYFALTHELAGFLAFALVVATLGSLAVRQAGGFPWRPVLLGFALVSLLIRGGSPVHQLPFYCACLALPLVLPGLTVAISWRAGIFVLVLLAACAVRLSLLSSLDQRIIASGQIPESTEFSRLVRAVTAPGDRIIAYPFNSYEYIAADRLPASGNYFYLPWQEKYNQHPRFGIQIDACAQIRASRPKIMLLQKETVWGHPWESYAQCIQAYADEEYSRMPGRPIYLRKDISPPTDGAPVPRGTP